jgi:hypothetical protein
MPVLCATDPISDIGTIAEENNFGFYIPSNDVDAFTNSVNRILASDIKLMGQNGYEFLKNNYLVDNTYKSIIRRT